MLPPLLRYYRLLRHPAAHPRLARLNTSLGGTALPRWTERSPQGLPGSWWTLMCLCRALRPRPDSLHMADPVGAGSSCFRRLSPCAGASVLAVATDKPRDMQSGTVPGWHNNEDSSNERFGARSHGLSTRYLRFAARVALGHHARLASGWRPTSTVRDPSPAGSIQKVSATIYIASSFSKLRLAQCSLFFDPSSVRHSTSGDVVC
jgi:hypothetical protein